MVSVLIKILTKLNLIELISNYFHNFVELNSIKL
jgi:hypothetical protein